MVHRKFTVAKKESIIVIVIIVIVIAIAVFPHQATLLSRIIY
jgi:hypothetical protein